MFLSLNWRARSHAERLQNTFNHMLPCSMLQSLLFIWIHNKMLEICAEHSFNKKILYDDKNIIF